MKIVALGHRKRVGKDTLARFLINHLRLTTKNPTFLAQRVAFADEVKTKNPTFLAQRVAFADEVKRQCHQLYRWAGLMDGPFYDANPEMREQKIPGIGKTPRQIWIEYGNKVREVYEHTWIDVALHGADADVIVVTDLRYPNEFNRVKFLGGFCIKVERKAIEPTIDIADGALLDVPDEKWDHIVHNDGDLNALYAEAVRITTMFGLLEEVCPRPVA